MKPKRKVLYTASTDIHLINFHLPYIDWFKKQGFEVHVACRGNKKIEGADEQYEISINRNPFKKENLHAYKQLKEIIDLNFYSIIHCHTPVCGVLTRLAAIDTRKKGTKLLYTAHGFHFYKGSPFKYWLIYYTSEVILSTITDAIIVMNNEDFRNLSKKTFKSKGKHLIDGIGVNPSRLMYDEDEINELKNKLEIKKEDIVFICIAEFIPRKNHHFIFKSLKRILNENKNIKFLFLGGFSTEKEKLELISYQNDFIKNIHFLGYQNDIGKYIAISDVGVSSSKAEGLPIGVLELMYYKKPVIASKIRGHIEIIQHGKNGYLFSLDNNEYFEKYVLELANNKDNRVEMGNFALESIEKFSVENAVKNMSDIYFKYF